jgi:hypothetical protein
MTFYTPLLHLLATGALALIVAVGLSAPASAQLPMPVTDSSETPSVALQDPESREAVRAMIATLSDDSVRALLIERLDAVADAKANSAANQRSALEGLQSGLNNQWQNTKQALSKVHTIPQMLSDVHSKISESLAPDGFSLLFMVLAGAIVAGLGAERLVARIFRSRKQQLIDSYATTLWGILKILYTRLSFDVLGVLAFLTLTTIVTANIYPDDSHASRLVQGITRSMFGGWLAYVICRFYFAPKRPELRICKTSDERAMTLTVSFSLLAAFIVLMHNTFYVLLPIALGHFSGWDWLAPLGFLINLSLHMSAAAVIWYNRDALTEILTENKKRVYLAIGDGTMGSVEKISLRSLRLRHHRGLVHTIPYGEIPKLTNFSRDWVIMKLRFRVPFDTDVNQIKKIFKKDRGRYVARP